MLWMIQYKLFIKNGGHFIWSFQDHRDKKKNPPPPKKTRILVSPVSTVWRWAEELAALPSCWTENAGWDWKSRHLEQLVRLEWQMERHISDRPAWSPETALRRWQRKALLSWRTQICFLSHLTFYKHVKKHIIALRLLSFSFTVLGRRVCAGGRGCVENWDQFKSERKSQWKQLKWADLLGGLDLCWRWSVYEAGWRCWDVSQENGSGWLVGRPGDGPESWPAAPGNDQDPAMVLRAPK